MPVIQAEIEATYQKAEEADIALKAALKAHSQAQHDHANALDDKRELNRRIAAKKQEFQAAKSSLVASTKPFSMRPLSMA